jgi:hypothetical protein
VPFDGDVLAADNRGPRPDGKERYQVAVAGQQMLEAIQGRLRERMFAATSELAGEQPDLATAVRSVWARSSYPRQGGELRLFFAVYGRALQDPQHFAGFLDRVVDDWMSALRDAQGPDTDPAIATRAATLVIATIRGLLLDLLTTGDRIRVQDAAESFLASLEHKAHRTGRPTLVGGDDTPRARSGGLASRPDKEAAAAKPYPAWGATSSGVFAIRSCCHQHPRAHDP